jgi:hypothetical protein
MFGEKASQAKLAKVLGPSAHKIYFEHGVTFETDKQPAIQHPFVQGQDEVVVGKIEKDKACASFGSTKGVIIAGWLPFKNLQLQPQSLSPQSSMWLGQWLQGPYNQLQITKSKRAGYVSVDGSVTWIASPYQEAIKNGFVTVGQIQARAKPMGSHLHLTQGTGELACHVDLTLLFPYLLANDNGKCGGLNAGFFGVYRHTQ